MLPTCIVIGCINSIHNQTVKYYKIPIENSNICRQWYINTLREDLEPTNNHYICIEHFDEESFIQSSSHHHQNGSKSKFNPKNNQILKEDAVPSLFEIEVFQKMIQHQELVSNGNRSISNSIDLQSITDNYNSSILQQQTLLENLLNNNDHSSVSSIKRRCSIRTCINSHESGGGDHVPLYSLPKTQEIAKKWLFNCQTRDTDLRVCRDHFQTNDFNEYNYLKPDAVPSNFQATLNRSHRDTTPQQQQSTTTTNKRARMDPEQRAELLSRIPKAVKRTTIQSLIPSQNNNSRIQKALKHTNQIMTTNETKFLSAALNNSKTIISSSSSSPLLLTQKSQNKTITAANKSQKAVKQTTTTLLKDILPPPIMQSTKRTPRAVKQTNNNINSQILIQQTPPPPPLPLKIIKQPIPTIISTNSEQTTTSITNSHKTTYVYKKVTLQPEIELYLECEDDESSSIVSSSINSVESSKMKMKSEETSKSPLNLKPIGNIQLAAVASKQQKYPPEKRYIQTLLKYYCRSEEMFKMNAAAKTINSLTLKCHICHQKPKSTVDLVSHFCSHLEGDNYVSPFDAVTTTCSVCARQFKRPFDLIVHMDTDHLDDLKEFKCRICESPHEDIDELLAHLNSMHSTSEMPYHCDLCDFRSSFYADAIYHVKSTHRNSTHAFCPYCLKSFQLKTSYRSGGEMYLIALFFYSHLKTHFDKQEETSGEVIESKCRNCPKCILNVRSVKEHLNADHNGLTPLTTVVATSTTSNGGPQKRKIQKAVKSTNSSKMTCPSSVFKRFDQNDEDEAIPLVSPIDFKIKIKNSQQKCLECGDGDLETHFSKSYTCHQCRYGTFCPKSYEFHLHSHLMSKRGALWNKTHHLDRLQFKCQCKFETNDGNLMAIHLLDCDRKATMCIETGLEQEREKINLF